MFSLDFFCVVFLFSWQGRAPSSIHFTHAHLSCRPTQVRDTVGHLSGTTLEAALSNVKVLFQFYGPGRHVRDKMTNLCLMDPKVGSYVRAG